MSASELEHPLVSVIMAVRNGERFVADAIDSIFAQDYRPLDVIVVDGQSTDSTARIVKSHPAIRYVWQTGKGVADAYNTGIQSAKGVLISFLSHDDLWSPHKLTLQVEYLMDHPEIQYVVAKVKYFLQEGCAIPPGFKAEFLDEVHTGIMPETICARRGLFKEIGIFNTDFQIAEDIDWFARVIDRGIPMAVLPEVLLFKRLHDQNTSLADVKTNSNLLLRAMRDSIHRKRNL
jgi:glycosyltransferase involved in cell wall biosynthesis